MTQLALIRLALPLAVFATSVLSECEPLRASEDGKLWGDYQMPSEPERGVLVAPGPDSEKVVEHLRQILERRQKTLDKFRNLRVIGRVSRASQFVAPSDRAKVDPRRIASDWCNFALVKQGKLQRYEQDYVYSVNDLRKKGRIFRLADEEAFYRLNVNGLDIEKLPDWDESWPMETIDFSIYELVDNGKGLHPLTTTLQNLIDRLSNPEQDDYFKKRNRFVRCYEENKLLVVDNVCGPDTPASKRGSRSTFWVDPSQDYSVVASKSQTGAPGRPIFSTTETRNTYHECAPGDYYLSTGECILGHFGEPKNRQQQTAWTRCNLEVQDVKFGDFECDSNVFATDLLPIPDGAPVTDYRKEPPATFKFGEARLSEQLQAHAAKNARPD